MCYFLNFHLKVHTLLIYPKRMGIFSPMSLEVAHKLNSFKIILHSNLVLQIEDAYYDVISLNY